MIIIAIGAILLAILLFFWDLFVTWLSIFIAPLKNLEILWIIFPIWISWFFAEFFQEKQGTDFGNAISNGVVVLWVGIDWVRYIFRLTGTGELTFGLEFMIKIFISMVCFTYGLIIVIEGIKNNKFIPFIGRIREVTYVLVMFSPIMYDIIELTWKNLLAMIVFFPIFYILIEIIDRNTPTPKYMDQPSKQTTSSYMASPLSHLPQSKGIEDFKL